MTRNNKKPAFLVVFMLSAIIAGDILLNTVWFNARYAQAEIKSGTEETANATTANNQNEVGIASDDAADYVVVWTDSAADGDGNGIYFRTFDRGGIAITSHDIRANSTTAGNQSYPSVAMTDNGIFVITWTGNGIGDDSGIFMRAFNLDGTPITDEFLVNTTTAGRQYLPEIALDPDNTGSNGRIVVTWMSDDGTQDDVYAQMINLDFTGATPVTPSKTGPEFLVNADYTSGSQDSPSVSMNTNGDFLIVWHGHGSTYPSIDAWYQAYDNTGNKIGANGKINSSTVTDAIKPRIKADRKTRDSFGGNYIVTYEGSSPEDTTGIFARQIQCGENSCKLNPVELIVNTTTDGSQETPEVASDYLGNFTVTWVDLSDGAKIKGQSFSYNDGKPLGQITRLGTEFQVNGAASSGLEYPSIAMNDDGQYAVAYVSNSAENQDIRFQRYVSDLFKVDTEILAHPASDTSIQSSPDVAFAPNGNHAAVWTDLTAPQGIRFTLWDKGNNIIVQNVRVDSNDPGNADQNPHISFFQDLSGPDQGRFIIVWEGLYPACAGEGTQYGVLYREVDSAGNIQGSCENKAAPSGSQPDVAAGFYNNDSGNVEDDFSIIYKDTSSSSVSGAFHDSSGFSYAQLDDSCNTPDCSSGSVAIDPANNHIVYAWANSDGSRSGIFGRQAVGSSLSGDRFQISPSGPDYELYPDIAFLSDNQFLATWSKTDSAYSFGEIWAARYGFNQNGAPDTVDAPFRADTAGADTGTGANTGTGTNARPHFFSKIASDPVGGDFLLAWSDMPDTVYNVYGRYFEDQGAASGQLVPFGPVFRINSTLDGAGWFGAGMSESGSAAVAWEGDVNQPGNVDSYGIGIQRLYFPLYKTPFPSLQPSAEQIITGGGRTVRVPDSIQYPASTVNATANTMVQTSIRDKDNGGIPIKYIEVTDLDGASFSLDVSINDDFVLTPPGTTSYIPTSAASIRNWDQNPADTDPGCSPATPLICVQTINSSATTTSFQLDTSTDTFSPFTDQLVLINKTAEHEIGKWRFVPEFKLNIPPRTPPGNHTTTIYFSLI